MQHYTTIEQSKKLVELGLNPETADMYYPSTLPKSGKFLHNPTIGNPYEALKWYNLGYTKSGKIGVTFEEFCIPCWSLGTLIELMPNTILDNTHSLEIYKCEDEQGKFYKIGYFINNKQDECCGGISMDNTNLTEAVYNMVIWLLENEVIKKGETK